MPSNSIGPLAHRLDRLVDAFESHGLEVRRNLLGASTDQLDAVEAQLAVRLPLAFRDLYGWSAGPVDPERDSALRFRDNTFLPLDRVAACRHAMMETYADPLGDPMGSAVDGIELATTVPFAEFMGSVLVVACGPQSLRPDLPHPVIGVFQGIEVFFLSIESMVDTCIDWVEQPGYCPHAAAPNETEIWLEHNPGLFA